MWPCDRDKHEFLRRLSVVISTTSHYESSSSTPVTAAQQEHSSTASTTSMGSSSSSSSGGPASTMEDFERHNKSVDLEFFVKAGIGCAVLVGFLVWFAWSFWLNDKTARGRYRRGAGGRQNSHRLQRAGSLDSQFSTMGSLSSSGACQRDGARVAAAERVADAAHFPDVTQFYNPMWAERHMSSDSKPGAPSPSSGTITTPRNGNATSMLTNFGVCSYTADDFPMPGFGGHSLQGARKPPLSRNVSPPQLQALGSNRQARSTWDSAEGYGSARVHECGVDTTRREGSGGSREDVGLDAEYEEARRYPGGGQAGCFTMEFGDSACFKDDME